MLGADRGFVRHVVVRVTNSSQVGHAGVVPCQRWDVWGMPHPCHICCAAGRGCLAWTRGAKLVCCPEFACIIPIVTTVAQAKPACSFCHTQSDSSPPPRLCDMRRLACLQCTTQRLVLLRWWSAIPCVMLSTLQQAGCHAAHTVVDWQSQHCRLVCSLSLPPEAQSRLCVLGWLSQSERPDAASNGPSSPIPPPKGVCQAWHACPQGSLLQPSHDLRLYVCS